MVAVQFLLRGVSQHTSLSLSGGVYIMPRTNDPIVPDRCPNTLLRRNPSPVFKSSRLFVS